MALNGLFCADVPLRNYSLTHSLTSQAKINMQLEITAKPSVLCCRLVNTNERFYPLPNYFRPLLHVVCILFVLVHFELSRCLMFVLW